MSAGGCRIHRELPVARHRDSHRKPFSMPASQPVLCCLRQGRILQRTRKAALVHPSSWDTGTTMGLAWYEMTSYECYLSGEAEKARIRSPVVSSSSSRSRSAAAASCRQ
jgi:hypothetical protein